MDNTKTGLLIGRLRRENSLTQKQLADIIGVSDKAVSKWERGIGCPDVSLIPELSRIFRVSASDLLSGELISNDFSGGNMKKVQYYFCKDCSDLTVSTGNAEIFCCGRKLSALSPVKPDSAHELSVSEAEDDWFIESAHEMTKQHYISFVAFATGDRLDIFKQYPEWNLQLHLPRRTHGKLLWYCTEHGLFYKNI